MATFSFSNAQYDPNTAGVKKQTQKPLPYLNDGSQKNILPMANTGSPDLAAGNQAVTATAQQQAVQGAQPSQMQQQASTMTQQMMKDPNFGYDPAKQKTSTLSAFDTDRAKSLKTAQRGMADQSGSGEMQRRLIESILAGNTDRTRLSNSLDLEGFNRVKQNWIDTINTGSAQAKAESDLRSTAVDNLIKTRGAYEGERSQVLGQEYNVDLANLGYDREMQKLAVQNGYDLVKLDKTFGHDTAMAMLNNDFTTARESLNRDHDIAMQSNDINAVSANIQKQIEFDKWSQQQGEKFTAEQNKINNALEIALQTNDIGAQKEILSLKAQIDSKELMTLQDFEATQASLDRAHKAALQENDINAATAIEKLRGDIDLVSQEKAQEFQDKQRAASQTWTTSERIDTQDFDKAMTYYDWAEKRAMQDNDIEGQKVIQKMRDFTQMNAQLNEMNHEEKMANIQGQINIAEANNDLEGRAKLLELQHTLDVDNAIREQGFDLTKIGVQAQIQEALSTQDFQEASILQNSLLAAQAREAAQDRTLESMRLQLQERGVNVQERQAEWDRLKSSGASEETLRKFLQNDMDVYGIEVEFPDQIDVYKEVQNRMNALRAEFLNTHPQYYNPETGWLTSIEGEAAFNNFYNTQMYGDPLPENANAPVDTKSPQDLPPNLRRSIW